MPEAPAVEEDPLFPYQRTVINMCLAARKGRIVTVYGPHRCGLTSMALYLRRHRPDIKVRDRDRRLRVRVADEMELCDIIEVRFCTMPPSFIVPMHARVVPFATDRIIVVVEN